MKTLDMNFIKSRRLELDLSLQEMAEVLGFKNASTYMKYEDGVYVFKANHLPLLAKTLKCSIGKFFTLDFAEIANDNSVKEVS